jgi:predicted PurR-regulated permease PerM
VAELQGRELTRILLTVIVIGGLIAASLWILRPFLGAIIWAIMIVVATWQLMIRVQRWAGGRRWVAVTVMSLVLLMVLVVPLSAAIGTVVSHVDDIVAWAKNLREFKLPPPPSWLPDLPLVGPRAVQLWQDVGAEGLQALAAKISPYASGLTAWFISQMGSFGALFIQFLLTVVAAAVLYAYGEHAADQALRFGERLGGERGVGAVQLSGQAIRGVARGVVLTALAQTLVGGLGVWIAGVPYAAVLTALMFLLAVAQIGAALVLVGPVIWLYWSGSPGWGTFLLVVAVIAGTLDNVLRPLLIKQGGADLPILLIFVGVIGGLISFGLIGIFIGPLVLAVTHTLLIAWLYGGAGMGPKSNTAPGPRRAH